MIPPNDFWWLSKSPPAPFFIFQAKLSDHPLNPSEVFSDPAFCVFSYNWFHLCSPKNLVIPPKNPSPPPSQTINNDRSLKAKNEYKPRPLPTKKRKIIAFVVFWKCCHQYQCEIIGTTSEFSGAFKSNNHGYVHSAIMRMEVRRAQFSLLKFKMKENKNTKRLSSLNSVSDIFYIHIFTYF